MNAAAISHTPVIQGYKKSIRIFLRMIVLILLYMIIFALSGQLLVPFLPDITPEPGPFSFLVGYLIVCTTTVLVITLAIYSSRWVGWKLILTLSLAYYTVVTVVTQLDSWFYLYGITIGPELMRGLFLQGFILAFTFIPLAVMILGRFPIPAGEAAVPETAHFSILSWVGKITLLTLACLVIYYCAGYYIAWQNPELRAFYGQSGRTLPFIRVMSDNITYNPIALPFQILRALIWIAGAALFVRGSHLPRWQTAVLTGLFFSIPQTIGLILPNPLMPAASVRLSHLIETAPSVFLFGCLVGWLLYPKLLSQKPQSGDLK